VFFDEAGRPAHLVGANVDITGRVRAETALSQFFSSSPTPMAVWGFDGRIQQANASWEAVLGFTAAELEGLPVFDLLHPEERAPAAAEFEELLVSGKRLGFECRCRCKDGSYRWILVNACVSKVAPVLYATAYDITKRKSAEEALQDSHAEFRELFDQAPVAYQELDPDGVVRAVNRAECALLGYEASEMLGRPIWDFIAGAELEASRELFRRKLSGEQNLEPHCRHYVRRDGAELWIEIHDKLVRNAAGETTGMRTALLDITERKRAQEDLQFRNILLSTQQEASIDGILVVDAEARVLSHNSRFVELWGLPPRLLESGLDEPMLQFATAQMMDPRQFSDKVNYLYEHQRETSRDINPAISR
jgi:PAS domain S-box-containing protein